MGLMQTNRGSHCATAACSCCSTEHVHILQQIDLVEFCCTPAASDNSGWLHKICDIDLSCMKAIIYT